MFLAITIVVRWIGRLIGESLTLRLTHSTRQQGRIIVQGLAHLVAYYVHQLLEYRLWNGISLGLIALIYEEHRRKKIPSNWAALIDVIVWLMIY